MMTTPVNRSSGLVRVLLPPAIGFAVATAAFAALIHLDDIGEWAFLAVLVPVAPVVWAIQRLDHHIERVDELQRLILLKGMASGFLVMISLVVLEGMARWAGIDASPWIALSIGLGAWVGSTIRAAAQYR